MILLCYAPAIERLEDAVEVVEYSPRRAAVAYHRLKIAASATPIPELRVVMFDTSDRPHRFTSRVVTTHEFQGLDDPFTDADPAPQVPLAS